MPMPRSSSTVLRRFRALRCCLVPVACCLFLPACSDYPQDTPEAVLASARQMVQDGHAEQLTDLIYADSKQMRTLLDQVGGLLGSLQDLALTVQKAYPKEIDKLKADAEEAAKSGNATGFLQQMVGQMGGGRRRRGEPRPDPESAQATFNNAMKELFADPYGWLQKSEGRLTVKTETDDTASFRWDGKPVFGVGLLLKLEKGRWYVMLPTVGPAAGILPKTQDGWDILGDMVQVFDNMLVDLTTEVKTGKCKRLEDVAGRAGEQAFLPAVLAFLAYGKYMDAERPAKDAAPPPGPSVQIQIGSDGVKTDVKKPDPKAPDPTGG